jgi:hypothetical protein
MNKQQLRNLISSPYFFKDKIEDVIAKGSNYTDKYFEDTIREDETEAYYQEN